MVFQEVHSPLSLYHIVIFAFLSPSSDEILGSWVRIPTCHSSRTIPANQMHIFNKYWEYGCILLYRYLPSVQSFFRDEPTTQPHVFDCLFSCAATVWSEALQVIVFLQKALSWVLFCAQQWQKSPNIDEYTQSSGTGGIHRWWWLSMMIKKMLLPLLLAAPAARPNHDIIRKPNWHEGKYILKK